MSPRLLAGGALALSVAVAIFCLAWPPGGGGGVVLATLAALAAAVSLVAVGMARYGWRAALTSPIVVVALVLIGVFVLRPGSLLADPRTAGRGLIGLGWDWSDLTSTVALATLGFVAFGLAFMLAWRPSLGAGHAEATARSCRRERTLVRGAIAALATRARPSGAPCS